MEQSSTETGDLSFSSMLKRGWGIYQNNLTKIAVLAAGYVLFMLLAESFILLVFPMPDMSVGVPDPDAGVEVAASLDALFSRIVSMLLISLLISIVSSLAGLYVFLAVSYMAEAGVAGKTVPLGALLGRSLSRWPATLYTSILECFFLFFLFLAFFFPGVLYFVYWFFCLYPVAFYKKSGREALSYSKRLVQGRWWTVFFFLLGIVILSVMLLIPPLIALGLLQLFLDNLATGILGQFIIQLIIAFYLVLCAVLFFDLERTVGQEKK